MSGKHSPLPWEARTEYAGGPGPRWVIGGAETGPDHTLVRVLQPSNGRTGTNEANATLIVAAVNSHEALVEALQSLLSRYTELVNCGDCGNWNPETEAEVVAARRALSTATQGSGEQ